MKTYEVTWSIKLTRTIEAGSKREALEISEDMGSAGVEDPAPDYEISAMKARMVSSRSQGEGGTHE
jgi:hypothetical protein